MLVELTDNGLKYDWYVTGPQGARFELFVHEGHSQEEIEAAKKQLRREQDVVKIYLKRVSKKEWDALKLFLHPNAQINKQLNQEVNDFRTS